MISGARRPQYWQVNESRLKTSNRSFLEIDGRPARGVSSLPWQGASSCVGFVVNSALTVALSIWPVAGAGESVTESKHVEGLPTIARAPSGNMIKILVD